jgi:hypothetical protein
MAKGFVYLLASENGLTKIGSTNNLDRRIGEIRAMIPVDVTLVNSIYSSDYQRIERELHTIFTNQRKWVKGEWFKLSPWDVKHCFRMIKNPFVMPKQLEDGIDLMQAKAHQDEPEEQG